MSDQAGIGPAFGIEAPAAAAPVGQPATGADQERAAIVIFDAAIDGMRRDWQRGQLSKEVVSAIAGAGYFNLPPKEAIGWKAPA